MGRRGVLGSRGRRRMLGPVSNEDEGAGSGTGCVRPLSLVTSVRAGAGARVRGGVVALSRLCGYAGYPGGVQLRSRRCECVCCRLLRSLKKHRWMPGISSSLRWG